MSAPAGDLTVVAFQVGPGRYALPVEVCRGVVAPSGVVPLPSQGPWVLGLKELQGRSVPVISLRAWLGLGPSEARERWLLAALGSLVVLLVADHVLGVFSLQNKDLRPPMEAPPGLLPAVTGRVFRHGEGLLVELRPEALARALGLQGEAG